MSLGRAIFAFLSTICLAAGCRGDGSAPIHVWGFTSGGGMFSRAKPPAPAPAAAPEIRAPEIRQVAYEPSAAEPHRLSAPCNPCCVAAIEIGGPHSVDEYVAIALAQNPDVQAAQRRVQAAAARVPQASSLEDPEVEAMGWPIFPNVPQYTSGRMTADVNVTQKVPYFGKLQAQADAARAEVRMAQADLRAKQLEIEEQVRRAYFELYYLQNAIRTTDQSRGLAGDFVEIADSRYRSATASQQDVLRAQVEVLNIQNELITMRQELRSGQVRLARLLHVAPESPLAALDQLPPEDVPGDLDRLYAAALAARPELRAQVAAVQRDRRMIDSARLQYVPDVTLLAGWGGMTRNRATDPLADGIDNINMGISANIPLYHSRIDAAVREAEAKAAASARQYDSLRDQTLEEVADLLAQAEAQAELTRLFEGSIVPKSQQTLDVSTQAYRTGQIDLLSLINNWRDVLRYRIALYRQESQLRQTLATLERVVGGVELSAPEAVAPGPLAPRPPTAPHH